MGYSLIGYIVAGAIIGALARLFMKGKQPLGIVWTIILGALGAFLGGWITGLFMNNNSGFIAWVVAIIVSIGLISAYLGITNKNAGQ
ncbi:GlsB/YeaQ/YmgE family stress response membrane protein [Gleimia hominis]|uniref:GlsB/YeaQ/YmgE family stress response membrane protein n=1 Tax=Gleimia hominis TaxID=595468 RepID=A0ABU3I7X8_9ACTO|nr:GlsB/YeaQ/YmgE family stress response membrane protein [Gleimia hominis]MDT3766489.1 GlsB/YeaQ/YmgE family stress response membrane protein [Gleimia hominis]